jgi:hypothetical protein
VLDNLSGDAEHVRGLPREDVGVVAQELCEGRFHVWGHAGAYAKLLLGVFRVDLDHLGVVSRAKDHHYVSFRAIQGLITRLAPDLGEVSGGDIGRGEGHAFLFAAICLGR